MAIGFTAGKQPGVPRARSGEGPCHVSKAIRNVLLHSGVSRQAGDVEVLGQDSPGNYGTSVASRDSGAGPASLTWHGAEEVLQQH